MVILIDASGSMHGVPMRIAKLAAQNLIDTFGDNDFFNVVYVSNNIIIIPSGLDCMVFAQSFLQEITVPHHYSFIMMVGTLKQQLLQVI